ncbi:MAG: hypothetical protein AAGH46_05060 [Bacteroidota bacterium]
MKKLKYLWAIIVVVTLVLACSNDDDGDDIIVIPDRDRGEQQIEDKEALISYLSTHYYNSGDFQQNVDYSIRDIVIKKADLDPNGIPEVPDGNTLLIEAVETKLTEYLDTDYEFYILRLNQGGGEDIPNFSDIIRAVYEGSLLTEDSVFDSSFVPEDFDLLNTIIGWQRAMSQFNGAEDFNIDETGIVNYINYGLGVMFLPSGLGYYSSPPPNTIIEPYDNLIFKFELYQSQVNDHDDDLVPSYLEDLNMNLDVFDDDTDGNGIADYFDLDDDGDGVLTANEDIDGDGDPTNDISPNDPEGLLPRYLDPTATDSNEDN